MDQKQLEKHLLHGTLIATIYGIDRLNYGCRENFCLQMNPAKFHKRCIAKVKRTFLGPQLYATVDLDKARAARTSIERDNPSSPQWNETFRIYCAHSISHMIFTVKDSSPIGAVLIGRAYLPVQDIVSGEKIRRLIHILDEEHHNIPGDSRIDVELQFISVSQDENWSQGIKQPEFAGVPCTFFAQRKGCKVTLYQDAHISNRFINPGISLSGEKHYEPQRCWEDIFEEIDKAQHFIYITGWSVNTEIKLVRDPRKHGSNETLGELLMRKAEEDVRVLVLVWDDRTSIESLKEEGLMSTHDEETAKYFRFSKVHCVLCPRNPDNKRGIVEGFKIATMFTHHQKTLVVDSGNPFGGQGKRVVVSFVGGIDLCDGRYDTQDHPLFRTLAMGDVHHNDFHQPNFKNYSIAKGGPREPWHDIHCKLEGPVAWDVLYNFEQRWTKQGSWKKHFLIPRHKLEEVIVHPPQAILLSDHSETWKVQLFRSIDDGAVRGFPEEPNEAHKFGLLSGKNNIIERSIQDAYINAIRRAKKFIYIENQYFIGSSFDWKSTDVNDADIAALNLIPKELSLKIASKIEAGERFAVYIVIPMWPEGIPESGPVQAILDWQRRTIQMMYTDIAEALKKSETPHANPRDYLAFFCLGNRETKTDGEYVPTEHPDPNSDYARAQQARRFMIYVHSKMMIVDDEYIITGSANINERSMAGSRDSEIAIGAFQPNHLATWQPARGQIYGLRMSLWREHLGELHESYKFPESEECIQRVNSIASDYWNLYTSETLDQDLPGHLLRYPINVGSDGSVSTISEANKCFPDTIAPVLGNKSTILPPIVTT